MKLNSMFCRLLCILFSILFFCTACRQSRQEQQQSQPITVPTPLRADGACSTRSVLLPETFVVNSLLPPHFTVIGDRVILTNILLSEQTSFAYKPQPDNIALICDMREGTVETAALLPITERPHCTTTLRTHIPAEDGGSIQLLEISFDPASYDSSDAPEYDDPVTDDMILVAADADGTVRLEQSVNALFADGYSHNCELYYDETADIVFLVQPESELFLFDRNGTLLDRLPWPAGEHTELVPGADGSILLFEWTDVSNTTWRYFRYDPAEHAFVPMVTASWTGYRIFPYADNCWFEHTHEGFVLRTGNTDGSIEETMLGRWVRSGYTDASIRELHISVDDAGYPRLYAITRDQETGRASLTLFDPYAEPAAFANIDNASIWNLRFPTTVSLQNR